MRRFPSPWLVVLAALAAAPSARAEDAAGSPPPDGPAAPAEAPAGAPDAAAARKAFDQAEVLREEGKWKEAAKAYGKSLDADEGQFLVHVRYQQVVALSGAKAELPAEYDEIVKNRPNDPAAKLHRLRLEPPAVRVATIAPLLKAKPGDAMMLLELGRAHLVLGDGPAAKKALESAFAIAPTLGDVLALSCEALRRAGDVEGARTRLENVVKATPDAYDAVLALARLQLAEGKAAEARERAEGVLTMRPSYVAALLVKAEAAARLDKPEDARGALDAALRINPEHTDAMLAAADLAAKTGTKEGLETGVNLYKKALALPGVDQLHGLYGLGWAYERQGMFKEAGEMYREANGLAPSDAGIVNSVGVMLLKQKSFQASLVQFRKAVDLDPKSPEAYLNIAVVAEQQSDWAEAIKQYQKVLAMKGQENNVRALLNCAFDHEALSQYKKAEELLVRVRQIRPDDADVAVFHGDNLFFQKKWKPSVKAYQDAVKLDEKNRFAWRGLGFSLSQDGKTDDALEALLKAKALKPDDPPTLIVLGDIYLADKQDLQKALENYEAYVKAGGTNPDVPTIIENIKNELAGPK